MIPIAKLTWSKCGIETNCSETMQKQSLMFKKEFQKSAADKWIEKIIGETGTPADGEKP